MVADNNVCEKLSQIKNIWNLSSISNFLRHRDVIWETVNPQESRQMHV